MKIVFVAFFFMRALGTLGFESRYMATEVQIAHLQSGLESFRIDVDRYPGPSEGLEVLVRRSATIPTNLWHGPYVNGLLQDAWGHAFVYRCPGIHNTNSFDLYSLGKDGATRTAGNDPDDINNWDSLRHWSAHYRNVEFMRRVMPLVIGGALVVCTIALTWWSNRISLRRADSEKA
jgi:general secretion pathway protein G